jgi:hypothetical protein
MTTPAMVAFGQLEVDLQPNLTGCLRPILLKNSISGVAEIALIVDVVGMGLCAALMKAVGEIVEVFLSATHDPPRIENLIASKARIF